MKDWYHSKTLWVNAVSLLALAGTLVLQNAGVLHLDPQAVIYGGIALSVLNAGLRLATNTAIAGTPAAQTVAPPAH